MIEPIIILGLIIYLILLYLSFETKTNILFALCGVFYLLPMSLYDNIILILLCAIGTVFHLALGFYLIKGE